MAWRARVGIGHGAACRLGRATALRCPCRPAALRRRAGMA